MTDERIEAVAAFLGHAFRNIDLPPLSRADVDEIAEGLARHVREVLPPPHPACDLLLAWIDTVGDGPFVVEREDDGWVCRTLDAAILALAGGDDA